jgi:hypothetical protein
MNVESVRINALMHREHERAEKQLQSELDTFLEAAEPSFHLVVRISYEPPGGPFVSFPFALTREAFLEMARTSLEAMKSAKSDVERDIRRAVEEGESS